MGRKLLSPAGDLNTSSGFKLLGLCHRDPTVASHPAQPHCKGLKARGWLGEGTSLHRLFQELENRRGSLCLVGTSFFPLMMADKSLPSLMSPQQVCTEQLLFGLCCPNSMCTFYLYPRHSCCEINLLTYSKVDAFIMLWGEVFSQGMKGWEETELCSKKCAEQHSKSQSCLAIQMFLETPNQCIPNSGLLIPTRQALHEERICTVFNLIYSLATESSLYFPILWAYVWIPIQWHSPTMND